MSSKIRKGDEVVILSGKYKKLRGKVLSVFPKKGKLIVSGINLVKKHQKPIPAMHVEGGIVEKEAPLFIGKVALFNPETKRPERIGFRIEEGKKIRFFKSTGKAVPCAE